MRYTITGRNIEITDGLKKAVEEKLHKLGKYFTRKMLIETLEKELNLNMDQFIKSEVAKCYERFQKGV